MDLFAHAAWVGIGLTSAARYRPISRRTAVTTLALAIAPDLVHLLPLLGLAITQPDGFKTLVDYALATPGAEPALPGLVGLLTHHLHCVMHSGLILAAVTAAVCLVMRSLWLPLLGWWSHVLIDVFTHSEDFYPSPVLYPYTYRGFDGLAWNTPWFVLANYATILLAIAALVLRSYRSRKS